MVAKCGKRYRSRNRSLREAKRILFAYFIGPVLDFGQDTDSRLLNWVPFGMRIAPWLPMVAFLLRKGLGARLSKRRIQISESTDKFIHVELVTLMGESYPET